MLPILPEIRNRYANVIFSIAKTLEEMKKARRSIESRLTLSRVMGHQAKKRGRWSDAPSCLEPNEDSWVSEDTEWPGYLINEVFFPDDMGILQVDNAEIQWTQFVKKWFRDHETSIWHMDQLPDSRTLTPITIFGMCWTSLVVRLSHQCKMKNAIPYWTDINILWCFWFL